MLIAGESDWRAHDSWDTINNTIFYLSLVLLLCLVASKSCVSQQISVMNEKTSCSILSFGKSPRI